MEEITRRPAEEVLEEQGYITDTVSENSMFPTLREGTDTVLIKPAEEILGKYDVILFRHKEKLLLQRIIKVIPGGYVARGDNTTGKIKVMKESVIGFLSEYQRGDNFFNAQTFSFRMTGALRQLLISVKTGFTEIKNMILSKIKK